MIKKSICKHYKRNCDKKAPCCGIYYPCRLCHDEQYSGPKALGCKVETMDRYNVQEIRCRDCLTEQEPSQECINCKIQFGRYYCDICKLFDDDKKKNIFHCDKCKMCRKGKREENFHCDKCDVCLPVLIQDTHQCIEKAFEQNCAICQQYLKNSTQDVQQLEHCAHFIHIICLNQSLKKGLRNCPVCNTAIYKMEKPEIEYYDSVANALREEFDDECKKKVVNIVCMDCLQKSESVPFNVYLKCQQCGSYNTRE